MSLNLIPPHEAVRLWSQNANAANAANDVNNPSEANEPVATGEKSSGFSAIIDVRSEDEFALDHWPGAINWPVLNNEERILIGTLYKQVSAFEAQKRGAALVARNIARHIEAHVLDLPKDWQPLLYCWRGGKRSGSISGVLSQIGFKVHLLEGGYKGFRHQVIEDIPRLIAPLRFHIISGRTGSGKTRLLQTLKRVGAQVLDLEDLACHRSSVLGQLPGVPQPSQKHFDTLIWEQLRRFNAQEVIFVESESKKVGNLTVPEGLIEKMRQSPCTNVELSMGLRVELLMQDYAFMALDREFFIKKLQALIPARGKAVIDQWKKWIEEGLIREVVQALLEMHYDPTYDASMKRNFQQIDSAHPLHLTALDELNDDALAKQLRVTANA